MHRTLTLLAVLIGCPPVDASSNCPGRAASEARARALSTPWPQPPVHPVPRPTYRLTSDTEVFLDGRPTTYRAIPAGARIARMEVTPENVILRVYFRSPE